MSDTLYNLYGGPVFPDHGLPARPGERGGREAMKPGWARLTHGQALGKKIVLFYNAEDEGRQPQHIPMLAIDGDDCDACQMVITLAPPTVIPIAFADLAGLRANQNVTGEQNNREIRTNPMFPGTVLPIKWPPLEAIIEWGTGGTSAKATVDYVNGLTVNLTASFVRVHAAIAAHARSGITGTSAAYTLAAFASPGFVQAGIAQRTVYVGVIDSQTESAVFSIPRFAKKAYLYACDPAAAPEVTIGTVRFWQSPDGVAGGNNVGNVFVSGNQPQAFDVPAGAAYFSILSGMQASVLYSVVFSLAI